MQNILDQIMKNIEAVTAIVLALAGLITLIITKYKEIKDTIDTIMNASKNKAIVKVIPTAVDLITQAKDNPMGLADTLVGKENVCLDPLSIPAYVLNKPDEAKKNIVAQALIEREPKLLKKMKLKDLFEVGNFVSGVYQFVKPIIKSKK